MKSTVTLTRCDLCKRPGAEEIHFAFGHTVYPLDICPPCKDAWNLVLMAVHTAVQLEQQPAPEPQTAGLQCTQCERTFTAKQALALHLRWHDRQAKETKKKECPHCGRKLHPSGYSRHLRAHESPAELQVVA